MPSLSGNAHAGIEPAIQTRNPARFQGLVQSERDGRVMATRPARHKKACTSLGERFQSLKLVFTN